MKLSEISLRLFGDVTLLGDHNFMYTVKSDPRFVDNPKQESTTIPLCEDVAHIAALLTLKHKRIRDHHTS